MAKINFKLENALDRIGALCGWSSWALDRGVLGSYHLTGLCKDGCHSYFEFRNIVHFKAWLGGAEFMLRHTQSRILAADKVLAGVRERKAA